MVVVDSKEVAVTIRRKLQPRLTWSWQHRDVDMAAGHGQEARPGEDGVVGPEPEGEDLAGVEEGRGRGVPTHCHRGVAVGNLYPDM